MARYNKVNLVEDLLLQDIFATTSKKRVTELVDDILATIQERVVEGDEVTFAGFGKFEKYERENGSFKPKFTAYKDFKDAVTTV